MKHASTWFTFLIVVFWLGMNAHLVRREVEFRRQGRYKSGIESYLGSSQVRESWMSIYAGSSKVGFTGWTVEKVYAAEGTEYQVSVETLYRGGLPVPALLRRFLDDSNQIEVAGRLILDEAVEPTLLRLQIALKRLHGPRVSSLAEFLFVGVRTGDRFLTEVLYGDSEIFRFALPAEKLALSNGLGPLLPVGTSEIGKPYRVGVFDPLSSLGFSSEEATVEVLGRSSRRIDGVLVDVFEVETRYRGRKTLSWVTASGDVLRQELGPPFDLVLRKEADRRAALRGFDAPGASGSGNGSGAAQEEDGR